MVRAGELEVSGDDQHEVDTYFDTENFAFHGPDGFDADYAGLTDYFRSVRDAFDDRSIRRGIVVVEGDTMACQTWIEGTFVRPFTHSPAGTLQPNGARIVMDLINIFTLRRPRASGRGVRQDRLPQLAASARSRGRLNGASARVQGSQLRWIPHDPQRGDAFAAGLRRDDRDGLRAAEHDDAESPVELGEGGPEPGRAEQRRDQSRSSVRPVGDGRVGRHGPPSSLTTTTSGARTSRSAATSPTTPAMANLATTHYRDWLAKHR